MNVDLSHRNIELILESLTYSKRSVEVSSDTPYELRQEKSAEIESLQEQLRESLRATSD